MNTPESKTSTQAAAGPRRPIPAQAATRPSAAARPAANRYAPVQWALVAGSLAAVVVGANGLARQEGALAVAAPVNLPMNAPANAPAAVAQTIAAASGQPLPVLNLPPVPTLPAMQSGGGASPKLKTVTLPSRPAARSRSSR
jgi:hypothetical protein